MKSNFKKSVIWNTLGSGINSVNSLIFLVIVTRINGLTDAGIFTLSFATASIFYVIAVYSGRTYQVTETEKDITDNEYILHRIITASIMLIVSILFAIINGYYEYKMLIFILLCMFKLTEAICDVFHGILQKNDKLDIVGKSLFIRSIINVIIFFLIDFLTKNLALACGSLILINILVLFFIDIMKSNKYKDKKNLVNIKAIFKIFKYGFFTFGFVLLSNYLVNAPRYPIDEILGNKFQTIFGIIVMPSTIIMLVNQFIIQPVIIKLKKSREERNKKVFLSLIYKVIGITLITGILSMVVAFFIGIPFLNYIYGLDLSNYLLELIIVLAGATFYTVASVFSNAMIVLRKTKIQLLIYFIASIFALIISYYLVKFYLFSGAIYSYFITMIILLLAYIVSFIIIVNNEELWNKSLIKN